MVLHIIQQPFLDYMNHMFPMQVVERIKKYFDLLGGPATFLQVLFFS